MCQFNYVAINRVNQFGCRISGYELLCYESGEIVGMTESAIIKMFIIKHFITNLFSTFHAE